MKNNKAFTLVEIIGVITVLSIILIFSVPALTKTLKNNEQKKYDAYIDNLRIVSENYVVEKLKNGEQFNGEMIITLGDLIDSGYVKDVIKNPENEKILSKRTYIVVSKDIDGTYKYNINELYRIPSEYQEVEYIQSTGTQYIDTYYIPKTNTKIITELSFSGEFRYSVEEHIGSIFGVIETRNNNAFEINFGASETQKNDLFVWSNYWEEVGTSSCRGMCYQLNITKDIRDNKNKLILENGSITYKDIKADIPIKERNHEESLVLFGLKYDKTSYPFKSYNMKAYNFQIYEDNKLITYFVPCYRKSDGVIGMYDLIDNKFYENDGTGTFLKGKNI